MSPLLHLVSLFLVVVFQKLTFHHICNIWEAIGEDTLGAPDPR
ncbi:unnamed protein product [Acidithrix sp. C25]|nr:unnamed protein product [Acidithrix sp. C25]